MFTLSDASKSTRQLLKWGVLIIAAIVVLVMAIRLALFVKEMFFPSPPPKADTSFGKLQLPAFPQNVVNQKLTFSINTLSGELPAALAQVKVLRIEKVQPDLLALTKFDTLASTVGFEAKHQALSDKVYEWKSNLNQSNLDRRLRINIVTYGFSIVSPYTTDADVLAAKDLPPPDRAKTIAQTMLENMESFPTNIDPAKTKTNLHSIRDGTLSEASSLSNAQIIEVNFVQNDIDNIPVFYENPNSSNISVLIGGGGNQGQIVAANYSYQKVSDDSSIYPIKTPQAAFDELKNGQGYIASYDGGSSNILINNVILAYYMGSQPQDFLMPIYVFEGNDNFYAYVGAVTDEWINK